MPTSIRCFHTSCSCSWNSSSRQRWSSVSPKEKQDEQGQVLGYTQTQLAKVPWQRGLCLQSQSCTNPPSTSWSSPLPISVPQQSSSEPHWTFQNERMQPQIEGRSLIRCQVKSWSFLNCLSDCFNFGLESCFSTFNLTYGNKRGQYVKFMFIFHQTHKNHKDRRQITLVQTWCKIFTSFRVIDH